MESVKPENLVEYLQKCPTGTTVFCHRPNDLFCKTIRVALKSVFDHTAIVLWEEGKQFIVEAKFKGGIRKISVTEWVLDRMDNKLAVSIPDCEIKPEAITIHIGKRYDAISVLLWFPVYRTTGVWLGRVDDKASKVLFCFEFTALARGLGGKWWRMVPQYFPEYTDDLK